MDWWHNPLMNVFIINLFLLMFKAPTAKYKFRSGNVSQWLSWNFQQLTCASWIFTRNSTPNFLRAFVPYVRHFFSALYNFLNRISKVLRSRLIRVEWHSQKVTHVPSGFALTVRNMIMHATRFALVCMFVK